MRSLRTAVPGTRVLICHPPTNYEGYTQDGEVIAVENEIIVVQFIADQIRTCRFHQENGAAVDTRLSAFIVRCDE